MTKSAIPKTTMLTLMRLPMSEYFKARNQQIIDRYLAGEKALDISKLYRISRARVSQILNAANISYKDTARAPRGDRYAFVGANISKEMKRRMLEESTLTGKSLSRIVEESLEKRYAPKRVRTPKKKKRAR
jgi:hypothetical protein